MARWRDSRRGSESARRGWAILPADGIARPIARTARIFAVNARQHTRQPLSCRIERLAIRTRAGGSRRTTETPMPNAARSQIGHTSNTPGRVRARRVVETRVWATKIEARARSGNLGLQAAFDGTGRTGKRSRGRRPGHESGRRALGPVLESRVSRNGLPGGARISIMRHASGRPSPAGATVGGAMAYLRRFRPMRVDTRLCS